MKEPVDHIIRPSLPWRSDAATAITECGFDASKVKAITRAEFLQRYRDMGQQRCALLTCMTCSDTARRWETWENDPRQALAREIAWERGEWRPRTDRGQRLLDELVAIETLVRMHREEFDEIVSTREFRRDWLEKKAAHQAKPGPKAPAKPRGGL